MNALSGYRCMWIVVMFDLPTETRKARREYALFRKYLLTQGFDMMQYSVYLRHCPNKDLAQRYTRHIRAHLPPEGEVRVLLITDKQFGCMQVFLGKLRKQPESAPQQLEFF